MEPTVNVQVLGGEVPVTTAVEALASRQEARLAHEGDLAVRVSALAERVATLERTIERQRAGLEMLGVDLDDLPDSPDRDD